jgi:hypothetical protein
LQRAPQPQPRLLLDIAEMNAEVFRTKMRDGSAQKRAVFVK